MKLTKEMLEGKSKEELQELFNKLSSMGKHSRGRTKPKDYRKNLKAKRKASRKH